MLKDIVSRSNSFTPIQLPGLAAWYDAADSRTITISTGVSQWLDKSGNGLTLTQGTGSSQPAYTTGSLNGLACLTFDGSDFLSSASISLGEITVFAVVSARWPTLETAAFFGQNFTTNKSIGRVGSAGFDYVSFDIRGVTNSYNSLNTGPRAIGPQPTGLTNGQAVQITTRLGSTGTAIRCNGSSIARVARNNPTSAVNFPITVGRPGSSYPAEYWNGRIAEIILCRGIINDTYVYQTESYLKYKWGL